MDNKVLIKLIVPELDETYDVFVPVNEVMWKVKAMLVKCICDLNYLEFTPKDEYILINKVDGTIYNNNEIVINTNIRNGTELFVFSK